MSPLSYFVYQVECDKLRNQKEIKQQKGKIKNDQALDDKNG